MTVAMILIAASVLSVAEPTPTTMRSSAPPATSPASTAAASATSPAISTDRFQVTGSFEVAGQGDVRGMAVDGAASRLYIARRSGLLVVDSATGAGVGEVEGLAGVGPIAVAPWAGRGFACRPETGEIAVFELKTLTVSRVVPSGKAITCMVCEPGTRRLFVGHAGSNDVTVIAIDDLSISGTIALNAAPTAAATNGAGSVYLAIGERSEVMVLNAKELKVVSRHALAPGIGPCSLACDPEKNLVFTVCWNRMMPVLDTAAGALIAAPGLGEGTDRVLFHGGEHAVLTSAPNGQMTVIAPTAESPFRTVQTLGAAMGGRFPTFDPVSQKVFFSSEAAEGTTLRIVVIGPVAHKK